VRVPVTPVIVRLLKVAWPEAFVVAVEGLKEAAGPLFTETVMVTPEMATGLFKLSRSWSTGGCASGTPI
jgi:hypothetical protein